MIEKGKSNIKTLLIIGGLFLLSLFFMALGDIFAV